MSNEQRDALGKLLLTLPVSDRAGETSPEIMTLCDEAADAILAAGYRKPRTIDTAEELDALPNGSVVLDGEGNSAQKDIDGKWWYWGGDCGMGETVRSLPATILWVPSDV